MFPSPCRGVRTVFVKRTVVPFVVRPSRRINARLFGRFDAPRERRPHSPHIVPVRPENRLFTMRRRCRNRYESKTDTVSEAVESGERPASTWTRLAIRFRRTRIDSKIPGGQFFLAKRQITRSASIRLFIKIKSDPLKNHAFSPLSKENC